MPRAVLISPNPNGISGGVERFCELLADTLRRNGWDTELVGPSAVTRACLSRLGLGPSLSAVSATRAARNAAPDLVISNGYLGGPVGTRRIHVFHGTMAANILASGDGSLRYRARQLVGGSLAEAVCARGSSSVVAVSESAAHELRHYYGQRTSEVIPNGIDTMCFSPGEKISARRRFNLSPDSRYALFVGRFERRKGADLVLQSCREAGYELVVAGPGGPQEARSLGELPPAELRDVYRAADCVLMPTRYEACSFVILEALATGVPLLTTDTGWFSEFLRACPDYRDLLITPTVGSISSKLRLLTESRLSVPTEAARRYIETHNSLSTFSARWLSLIDRVMR